jgi:DnaJ-class molecular chaperone
MTRIPDHSHSSRGRASSEPRAVTVPCAFCGGTGLDPFEQLGPRSTCQVCSGAGANVLNEPTRVCAFCEGTGVFPQSRLTCTCCSGVGVVEAAADSVSCPRCGGSGRADDDPADLRRESRLPCANCGGKGFVLGGT